MARWLQAPFRRCHFPQGVIYSFWSGWPNICTVSQRACKIPLSLWPKPHIFGHGIVQWYSFWDSLSETHTASRNMNESFLMPKHLNVINVLDARATIEDPADFCGRSDDWGVWEIRRKPVESLKVEREERSKETQQMIPWWWIRALDFGCRFPLEVVNTYI